MIFAIVLGIVLLILAMVVGGVPLLPDMFVASLPLLYALGVLLFGRVRMIKPPAWLSMPIAFCIWGGTAGRLHGGELGCSLCVAGFGLMGMGLGVLVEQRRSKKTSPYVRCEGLRPL